MCNAYLVQLIVYIVLNPEKKPLGSVKDHWQIASDGTVNKKKTSRTKEIHHIFYALFYHCKISFARRGL